LVLCAGGHAFAQDSERLLVRVGKPYDAVVAAVQAMGGTVEYKYANVDALAVTIPRAQVPALTALMGPAAITKDMLRETPPAQALEVTDVVEDAQVLDAAGVQDLPADYIFNNTDINVDELHAAGRLGNGVIVAVIDSGTANSPLVPALTGSVIGGENFVPGDAPSATSRLNNPHGTWVGTVIAGHVIFAFNPLAFIVATVSTHAPEAIVPCPPPLPPSLTCIPMIGVAPASSIYAMKVFPSTGGGSPESRIIAAMDRAITLRRNFNNGVPSMPVSGSGTENDPFVYNSLRIDVVNMSLGGPTFFAGRDLEDSLTRTMLEVGITIVTSSGNDGFAAITGGSPGTGIGSETVGAANDFRHERILRDLQFGLGIGVLYRPSTHLQTADFSARGPTADGRLDPEISANGYATFAQGANGGLSVVSGTSFSSPTVAGAAAVLREAGPPKSTATQIRNAINLGARKGAYGDGSTAIDQGAGYLDVGRALAKLPFASKRLPDGDPCHDDDDGPGQSVERNVKEAGFGIVKFDRKDMFQARVKDLLPGQVRQFFVPVGADTDQLIVTVKNITPALPPEQQNQLFGDDILFEVVDAPTSFAEFRDIRFLNADFTATYNQPQTGLVRVALQGDWTNAGRITADVVIQRVESKLTKTTASGRVIEGEVDIIEVEIPDGTSQAVFDLHWEATWGRYPTNDLDMFIEDPNGVVNSFGASLSSPERVQINTPTPGVWTVFVEGFTVHDRKGGHGHDDGATSEKYRLRVTADGVALDEL
jgi:subtilisin family serine protease